MSRAQPSSRRGDLGFLLALLLVALLPRLYVAVAWSREPVWDGHYYHFGAERIAAGLGYSEDVWVRGHLAWRPWIHYPVGYSAFLGFFYRIFGSNLLVAPILNALLGTLLCGFTYRLAAEFLSRRRARIAGALVALHPGLIAYSALLMTEVLAALLLTALGWLLVTQRGRSSALIVGGLLLGCATLVRPASLLVLPLVAFTEPGGALRALRGVVLVALASCAVVLPWTLRNCERFDGCALVSTNGGWNLAIGAISETGRFQTLRASDGCAVVHGQVEQDRCWAEIGKRKILAHPLHWLSLAPKKLAETFSHESFAFEYLHEADPVTWPEARRVSGRELASAYHRLLMAIAALGVVGLPLAWRERPLASSLQGALLAGALGLGAYGILDDYHPIHWLALFIPVVGFLPLAGKPEPSAASIYVLGLFFSVVLTHAIFFGEDRYHIVATPMLCVLAAAALRSERARRFGRAEERGLAVGGA